MARSSKEDQLDLFPGMQPATPAIRPWRVTLADDWRRDTAPHDLEPGQVDLLRRSRQFLKALTLAGVPDDAPGVQRFRRHEAPLMDHWVLLRRGEVPETDTSDLARAALETADELAEIRHQILGSLEPEVRERALKAEPRVRIDEHGLYRELAAKELALAEEQGDFVEIVLSVDEDAELPSGFLGLADVEALARHSEQVWKAEQEQRDLPRQLKLATLLKGIPAIWLEAICIALGVDDSKLRLRRHREQAVARILSDADQLRGVVLNKLSEKERELLAYLLERDGELALGLVTGRFGRDAEDGWFWHEEPPTSVLGRLRLHGLAFVGRLPKAGRQVRTVAIPRELREPLGAALDVITTD